MERLHKFLAHCGIASRRKAEEIILEGRVTINGEIVDELGVKIDPENDIITVDGKTIHQEKKIYLLLHKPKGYTTTAADEYGRKTVLDLIDPEISQRIYPAGRLDKDSEGLIMLTNDGDVSYYLTHPSQGIRKVYEVTVEGIVESSTISDLLTKGIRIGAILVKPSFCKIIKKRNNRTVLKIGVSEGVNREVRRLFAIMGHEVKRLIRLEIGSFSLKGISKGKYRMLSKTEIKMLLERMANPSAAKMKHISKYRPKRRGSRPSGKPDPAQPGRYKEGRKQKQSGKSTKKKSANSSLRKNKKKTPSTPQRNKKHPLS